MCVLDKFDYFFSLWDEESYSYEQRLDLAMFIIAMLSNE